MILPRISYNLWYAEAFNLQFTDLHKQVRKVVISMKKRNFLSILLALLLCVAAPLSALASTEGGGENLSLSSPEAITAQDVLAFLGDNGFKLTCSVDQNHGEKIYGASLISQSDLTIGEISVNKEEKTASVTVSVNTEGVLKQYNTDVSSASGHTVSDAYKTVNLVFTSEYVEEKSQWTAWNLTTQTPVAIPVACEATEPPMTYSVLFKINLPNVSWEEQINQVAENTVVKPATLPSIENYELIGWSTDPEAETAQEQYTVNGKDADKDGMITLFGVWRKTGTYTLVFDDNGTDIVEPDKMTVSAGDEVKLTGLGKSGDNYRLLGWALDPDVSKYSSTYVVSGDDAKDGVITLYAVTSRKAPSYDDDDFIYVKPTDKPSNTLSPEVIPTTKPQPTATGTSPLPDPVIPKTGDSLTEEMTYAGVALGGIAALAALLVFRRKHA